MDKEELTDLYINCGPPGSGPVQIELKDGQSGYDVVSEYVYRFWHNNGCCDAVVCLWLSNDGINWIRVVNEVASLFGDHCRFLNDWWNGEKFILLFGMMDISGLDTIYGGIYEE